MSEFKEDVVTNTISDLRAQLTQRDEQIAELITVQRELTGALYEAAKILQQAKPDAPKPERPKPSLMIAQASCYGCGARRLSEEEIACALEGLAHERMLILEDELERERARAEELKGHADELSEQLRQAKIQLEEATNEIEHERHIGASNARAVNAFAGSTSWNFAALPSGVQERHALLRQIVSSIKHAEPHMNERQGLLMAYMNGAGLQLATATKGPDQDAGMLALLLIAFATSAPDTLIAALTTGMTSTKHELGNSISAIFGMASDVTRRLAEGMIAKSRNEQELSACSEGPNE